MPGIGMLNETELHEQLKHLYAGAEGETEQVVEGFVVDVVRDGELIEIQTRGFGKMRRKLVALSATHRVRIVHPIATETVITKLSDTGEIHSSRRSPRKGRMEEIYREIVSIADLLPHENIAVEAVMVRVVETRIDDGKGSWRRRGVSIVARQLGAVDGTHRLTSAKDYLHVLPSSLEGEFTNADLIRETGLRYRHAQPITSSLRKMGLVRLAGKRGREQLYEITKPRRRQKSSRARPRSGGTGTSNSR